jgi:hypothetical protein
MHRLTFFFASSFFLIGCRTAEPEWSPKQRDLDTVVSITLVFGWVVGDGGTIELRAVNEQGERCSVAFSVSASTGEGQRELLFNGQVVDVRSASGVHLFNLLANCRFKGIDGDTYKAFHFMTPSETVNALDQLQADRLRDKSLEDLRNAMIKKISSKILWLNANAS